MAEFGYYPVDRKTFWRYNGGNVTVAHILGNNHNQYNWNRAWLESLSTKELNELHSDLHENDVRTNYIMVQ